MHHLLFKDAPIQRGQRNIDIGHRSLLEKRKTTWTQPLDWFRLNSWAASVLSVSLYPPRPPPPPGLSSGSDNWVLALPSLRLFVLFYRVPSSTFHSGQIRALSNHWGLVKVVYDSLDYFPGPLNTLLSLGSLNLSSPYFLSSPLSWPHLNTSCWLPGHPLQLIFLYLSHPFPWSFLLNLSPTLGTHYPSVFACYFLIYCPLVSVTDDTSYLLSHLKPL